MPMPGNYNLKQALNRALPVFGRVKLGNQLDTLINTINAFAVQLDQATAAAYGAAAIASGTITVGGTITAGNTYSIAFVDSAVPTLVSPGVTITGTVVTGDTTTTIATRILASINANAILDAAGVLASSAAAVVTVRMPGTAGNSLVITATPTGTLTLTAVQPTGGTGSVAAQNASAYTMPTLSSIP